MKIIVSLTSMNIWLQLSTQPQKLLYTNCDENVINISTDNVRWISIGSFVFGRFTMDG